MGWLTISAAEPRAHLILAHGAGASMVSPFMTRIAEKIGEHDVSVHRFEFAYMVGRSSGGVRRPPPKIDGLIAEYKSAVADVKTKLGPSPQIFIGGKSMGGRVASLIADEVFAAGDCAGLVCLGYPFHPVGKPESLRTEHLAALKCPALIVQGERDPFGTRDEVARYTLSKLIRLEWLTDGDHDFKPRAKSGVTHDENLTRAAEEIAGFVLKVGA
jgi:uncharacterized protein